MEPIFVVILVFLVMLFAGIPVAYAMLGAAEFYFLFLEPSEMTVIPQRMLGLIGQSFTLLAVPLFLFAGRLLNDAGMTGRLVAFAMSVVGHIRGGIGHAVVVSNIIMAGMSGSAVADAAGIGSMMIPVMTRSGYTPATAAALSAAAACIGPIIPPSIVMVIYSSLAGVSLGAMLLSGIFPGLLLGIVLMVGHYLNPESARVARGSSFTWRQVAVTGKDAVLAFIMPAIILGGIFSGVYTPTEGAAVAVLYSLVIGVFVYRTLTPTIIYRALEGTAVITGAVLLIVAAASALSWVLTTEGAGDLVAAAFASFQAPPEVLLLLIALMIIALGCVVEDTTIVVILAPILAPIAVAAGIDPIQFGLVFVLSTVVGLVTPPVGITMYITAAIAHITINEFARAIWRPMVAFMIAIVILCLVPAISTFLPHLVLG